MKLRVLGAYGAEALGGKHASAFLINGRVLLDAGSVASVLNIDEQLAIEHVLLSHSHLDHVAGLGYLSETRVMHPNNGPLPICSAAPVLKALKESFFNNTVWPDFSAIPSRAHPTISYRRLRPQVEVEVGGLYVTPVAVNHTVRTVGFVVRDGKHSFVYSGDTGPTAALWKVARKHPEVRTVVLECSYPDRFRSLANISKHMTPSLIGEELNKLPPKVRVMIFHVKPAYYRETAADLRRLNSERIVLLEQGRTYELP